MPCGKHVRGGEVNVKYLRVKIVAVCRESDRALFSCSYQNGSLARNLTQLLALIIARRMNASTGHLVGTSDITLVR